MLVAPVAFPLGWLRLATTPAATGSIPSWKTIGIVVVAALAASVAGMVMATITDTRRRTNSAAKAGNRSYWLSAQLYSKVRLRSSK